MNMRLVKEKKVIEELFMRVAAGENRACYGLKQTMRAFEQGAVQTMILWEDLDASRLVLKGNEEEGEEVVYIRAADRNSSQKLQSRTRGREILREDPLIDWVTDNSMAFGGFVVQLVSQSSAVCKQFIDTFDGIGALLSYPLMQLNLSDSSGGVKEKEAEEDEDTWPFDM